MPKSRDAASLAQVENTPKRMAAWAIGADDGQCGYCYGGAAGRCQNDAVAFTWTEATGERARVEICEEHVREEDQGVLP